MASLNLQRTKKAQEGKARLCGIVERFVHNQKVGFRSDLYGLFDLMSCKPGEGIIGVQCCGTDFAAHYRKITIEKKENALYWLRSGGKIELWGWRKLRTGRGTKEMRYQPRIVAITEADFIEEGQCETA